MGYIDPSVELDAILTKKGRELLTSQPDKFNITKFALADDEIDYRLWNTNHTLGSEYYGEVIDNTPVIEPIPVENQVVKFKLITMPQLTSGLPVISLGSTSIDIRAGQRHIITPFISNVTNGNTAKGFTAVLSDSSLATLLPEEEIPGMDPEDVWEPGDSGTLTVRAITFVLRGITIRDHVTRYGTVTITGNEYGGRVVLQFTLVNYFSSPIYGEY